MNPSTTRKPLASFIIGLIFGPVVGMLYLNRGIIAVCYTGIYLVLLVLPFLFAQYDLILLPPQRMANILIVLLQVIGAFHCYLISKNKIELPLKWYAYSYNIFFIFSVIIGATVLQRTYFYEPFFASGASMEPTLSKDDYFVINKHGYNNKQLPERGDIIVFNVRVKDRKAQYVKRVIGLPGETIKVIGNDLFINNEPLQKKFAENDDGLRDRFHEVLPGGKTINIYEARDFDKNNLRDLTDIVPQNHYFVVGDNRGASNDSRNGLGDIALEDINGKVEAIFYNLTTYKLSYKTVE